MTRSGLPSAAAAALRLDLGRCDVTFLAVEDAAAAVGRADALGMYSIY